MVSSCFNYDSAKGSLVNLDMGFLASKTMHFTTAAEAHQDPAISDLPGNNGYGARLQLATFVNLDSRISVSPILALLTLRPLTDKEKGWLCWCGF